MVSAIISFATPGDRRKVRLMKIKAVISLAAIAVLSRLPAEAQIYDTNSVFVQTFAGSGLRLIQQAIYLSWTATSISSEE
jgi:hypothetical protein